MQIQEAPIQTNPEAPDPKVTARMSFYLVDNLVEHNEINLKKSEIVKVRESLVAESEKRDSKGFLVIQGTKNNPDDFLIAPWKNVVAIKFQVQSVEE